MAHQLDAEAGDVPATLSMADAAAVFDDIDDTADETAEVEEVADPVEGEDLDLEEEQADESDEPETAIDAPVSLNAEEKAVFAQLPPEAQQAWAASETRRNAQVQEATTKASNAQREAEARAAQADAEAKSRYSAQLEEIGKAFVPTEPDRRAYHDDTSYLIALRQYDQQVAQHESFMQQVRDIKEVANTEAEAAFIAQRDRELMAIPEVANAETREGYLKTAFDMAAALGYDQGDLAKSISAAEVKSLVEIAGWRDKAAKFDKAMARQMQKVRSAKGKSLRPGVAQTGVSDRRADSAMANYRSNPSSMAAAAAVFEDI